MIKIKQIYEGIVEHDKYGSWSDCSPGWYVDGKHESIIISAIANYKGRRIRITIEEVDDSDG